MVVLLCRFQIDCNFNFGFVLQSSYHNPAERENNRARQAEVRKQHFTESFARFFTVHPNYSFYIFQV